MSVLWLSLGMGSGLVALRVMDPVQPVQVEGLEVLSPQPHSHGHCWILAEFCIMKDHTVALISTSAFSVEPPPLSWSHSCKEDRRYVEIWEELRVSSPWAILAVPECISCLSFPTVRAAVNQTL